MWKSGTMHAIAQSTVNIENNDKNENCLNDLAELMANLLH